MTFPEIFFLPFFRSHTAIFLEESKFSLLACFDGAAVTDTIDSFDGGREVDEGFSGCHSGVSLTHLVSVQVVMFAKVVLLNA